MRFSRLAKKNKTVNEKSFTYLYESLVVRKIRARYTINQELAIIRQRDEKPSEFAEYNNFVERCKAQAKAELS